MRNVIIAIVVVVLGLLGLNYYLWSNEVKMINQDLLKIETQLAKGKVKLTYDKVDYGMMKAWDVKFTMRNVKLAKESNDFQDELIFQTVHIRKDYQTAVLEYKFEGDISHKTKTMMGEKDYKIVPKTGMPTLRIAFDKLTGEVYKLEYSDAGLKMIDNKTQHEVVTSDANMFSISKAIEGQRNKIEFIMNSKNNIVSMDRYDMMMPIDEIMSDVPDLGGHDYSINVFIDVPVLQDGQAPSLAQALNIKVDLRELKFSNKVFSIGLDGKVDGTTGIPSGNLNLSIGNYEKLIDITYGIVKKAAALQQAKSMHMKLEVTDEQIAKFKVFLSRFKTNDTDIKIDFVMNADGSSTVGGKPAMEYANELQAIFMPPKAEVPAPMPPVVTPEGNVAPAPMPVPAPAPAPEGGVAPQPAPMPAPQMPVPGEPVKPIERLVQDEREATYWQKRNT